MTWIVLLLVLAAVKRKKLTGQRFLLSGIACLFLFSNNALYTFCVKQWELDFSYIKSAAPKSAVVLGGFSSWDDNAQSINFNMAADRLLIPLGWFKDSNLKHLYISGGSGRLVNDEVKESDVVLHYLKSIGFTEEQISIENKSRNTRENALYIKPLLTHTTDEVYLITSAQHMRRAYGCFKKLNISVIPYSVDSSKNTVLYFSDYILPDAYVLAAWNSLLKEWIGYITYRVMGYI